MTNALFLSTSNEWYTPSEIIESARSTMGSIDLDPFSCPEAQKTVQAKRYYSLQRGQDGFTFPWFNNVWCNPPYGADAKRACLTGLNHWRYGRLDNLIMLVRGDNDGLDRMLQACNLWVRCDRIKFNPSIVLEAKKRAEFQEKLNEKIRKGEKITQKEWNNSPVPGSVIVYFGKNSVEFLENFRKYGLIFPSSIN